MIKIIQKSRNIGKTIELLKEKLSMNIKTLSDGELLTLQTLIENELKSRRFNESIIRDKRFLQEFLDKYPKYEVRFRQDDEYGEPESYGFFVLEIKNKILSVWRSIDSQSLLQIDDEYGDGWYCEYSKIVPAQMVEVMEGCYEYIGTMPVKEYLGLIGFELVEE